MHANTAQLQKLTAQVRAELTHKANEVAKVRTELATAKEALAKRRAEVDQLKKEFSETNAKYQALLHMPARPKGAVRAVHGIGK